MSLLDKWMEEGEGWHTFDAEYTSWCRYMGLTDDVAYDIDLHTPQGGRKCLNVAYAWLLASYYPEEFAQWSVKWRLGVRNERGE